MTTIEISGTLTFNNEGKLLKSEFMGFTITQEYWNWLGMGTYLAVENDNPEKVLSDKTLSSIISDIINYRYEKAI